MNVLLLAPHPFFQTRGTPIDVLLVLRVLSEREDTTIDVIVYPEGEDISLPSVTIHRVPFVKKIKGVRPGFSIKKLWLDFLMFFFTWKMVHKNRYDLIHADEESVFIAMSMKLFYNIPYIYDIDSSIAQQMIEKYPSLKMITKLLSWLEGRAIRGALANAPVCNALRDLCKNTGPEKR